MKKRVIFIFLFLLLSLTLLHAEENPTAGFNDEDLDRINEGLDQLPVDDEGNLDSDKLKPRISKAEERIEKINDVLGPITKLLFGSEIELSWEFLFTLLVWLVLASIIASALSNFLPLKIFITLPAGFIISSLMMHIFRKQFISMIEPITETWWASLITILLIIIVTIIINIFMRIFGKKLKEMKKREKEQRRESKQKILEAVTDVRLKGAGVKH